MSVIIDAMRITLAVHDAIERANIERYAEPLDVTARCSVYGRQFGYRFHYSDRAFRLDGSYPLAEHLLGGGHYIDGGHISVPASKVDMRGTMCPFCRWGGLFHCSTCGLICTGKGSGVYLLCGCGSRGKVMRPSWIEGRMGNGSPVTQRDERAFPANPRFTLKDGR